MGDTVETGQTNRQTAVDKRLEQHLRPQDGKVSAPLRSEQNRRPPDVLHPRQGAKAAFDRRRLSKVLLRYFRESNKAYAPYPALAGE